MNPGTFNFWIDRNTTPDAFNPGTRCRWATFQLDGETCVVSSDGPTLTATLRVGTPEPIRLFRVPFSPSLTRRHQVTIGWSKGRIKVLLDAKQIAEVKLALPEPQEAAENAPTFLSVLPPALLASLLVMFPSLAHVHPGVRHPGGFGDGFAHPFGGLDHLCAMIAVGLWAAQRGGRSLWLVPLTFVSVMAVGGFLGMAGITLPFVEAGIVASVLIFGVLIAAAVRLPPVASAALVGLFAILPAS